MSLGRIYLWIVVIIALVGLFYISKKQVSPCEVIGKTLIVGTNAEFPPFSFIQNGHITGFDIDVIEESHDAWANISH
jgi:ABC-type amino acid transport substrate-binding protein